MGGGMSAVQHTPGPWVAAEEDWHGLPITAADREGMVHICMVPTGFREPFEIEQQANARLIAAAPDMLAALREAERILSGLEIDEDCHFTADIRAAIAKAEGRL